MAEGAYRHANPAVIRPGPLELGTGRELFADALMVAAKELTARGVDEFTALEIHEELVRQGRDSRLGRVQGRLSLMIRAEEQARLVERVGHGLYRLRRDEQRNGPNPDGIGG